MKIETERDKLIIKKRGRIIFLNVDEILFLERFGANTLIHTQDNEIKINNTLKEVASYLPDYFVRAHRSFVINKSLLKELKLINDNTYEALYPNEKSALINKKVVNSIY